MHKSSAGITTADTHQEDGDNAIALLNMARTSIDPAGAPLARIQADRTITLMAAALGTTRSDLVGRMSAYYQRNKTDLAADAERHIRGVVIREISPGARKRARP